MGSRRNLRSDRWPVLAAAIVIGLACGGCANVGEEADLPDEATLGEEQSDAETGELVTPRPGMTDVEPVRIWLEKGSWDGDLSYVMFLSQGAPCEVLDHIDIEERKDVDNRWLVTLYQGRDPDIDPAAPCDGPWRAFTVVLPAFEGAPDGDVRELVNGADLLDER